MSLETFAERFTRLQVNTARSTSLHKPCLLRALIDKAESGGLQKNEVRYTTDLIERFAEYFDVVRGQTDHPNAYFPFFHLRGDGFWTLVAKPDRQIALDA